MPLLICQDCGGLLKEKFSTCKTCGANCARGKWTTIDSRVDSDAASVFLTNDPLELERTVLRVIHGASLPHSSSYSYPHLPESNGTKNLPLAEATNSLTQEIDKTPRADFGSLPEAGAHDTESHETEGFQTDGYEESESAMPEQSAADVQVDEIHDDGPMHDQMQEQDPALPSAPNPNIPDPVASAVLASQSGITSGTSTKIQDDEETNLPESTSSAPDRSNDVLQGFVPGTSPALESVDGDDLKDRKFSTGKWGTGAERLPGQTVPLSERKFSTDDLKKNLGLEEDHEALATLAATYPNDFSDRPATQEFDTVPTGYAQEQYADGQYSEQQYSEQQYSEQQYSERQYPEQQYPEQQYAEQQHPEQQYPEHQYPEEQYSEQQQRSEQQYSEQPDSAAQGTEAYEQDQYAEESYDAETYSEEFAQDGLASSEQENLPNRNYAPQGSVDNEFNPAPVAQFEEQFDASQSMSSHDEFNPAPGTQAKEQFATGQPTHSREGFDPAPTVQTEEQFNPGQSVPSNETFDPAPLAQTEEQFHSGQSVPSNETFAPAPTFQADEPFDSNQSPQHDEEFAPAAGRSELAHSDLANSEIANSEIARLEQARSEEHLAERSTQSDEALSPAASAPKTENFSFDERTPTGNKQDAAATERKLDSLEAELKEEEESKKTKGLRRKSAQHKTLAEEEPSSDLKPNDKAQTEKPETAAPGIKKGIHRGEDKRVAIGPISISRNLFLTVIAFTIFLGVPLFVLGNLLQSVVTPDKPAATDPATLLTKGAEKLLQGDQAAAPPQEPPRELTLEETMSRVPETMPSNPMEMNPGQMQMNPMQMPGAPAGQVPMPGAPMGPQGGMQQGGMPQGQIPQGQMPMQQTGMPQGQMPMQGGPQGGAMPGQPAKPRANKGKNPLTGLWSLDFKNPNGAIVRGQVELEQMGQDIRGVGADPYGTYQIGGRIVNKKVSFNKLYVQNGQAVGNAIPYSGKLSKGKNGLPRIDGVWKITRREGYNTLAHFVTHSYAFRGLFLQAPPEPQAAPPQGMPQQGMPQQGVPAKGAQQPAIPQAAGGPDSQQLQGSPQIQGPQPSPNPQHSAPAQQAPNPQSGAAQPAPNSQPAPPRK